MKASNILCYVFLGVVFGLLAMCAWATYWQSTDVKLWLACLASMGAGAALGVLGLAAICACIRSGQISREEERAQSTPRQVA